MMRVQASESRPRISGCRRRIDRCAGISLFELVVAIVIVGVLGTFLSGRLLRYQEYAEKTAMEATARQLQTGLRLQVADLMMRDKLHEIDRLLQQNPMTWLETVPPHYIGERTSRPQEGELQGSWYFDTEQRTLVYTPFHHRFFKPQQPGLNSISYRLSAVPVMSRDGARRVEGLTLLLLSPYKWEIPLGWDEI